MPSHEKSLCPLCLSRNPQFFFDDPKNYRHTYYHCDMCDFVFVSPECRLSAEDEKSRYDMHNNGHDDDYVHFLSRLALPILTNIPDNANGLDFGSGRSDAMATIFRNQGHSCSCYDIFYYPDESLLNQHYDFIVASEVIEHIYNPYDTIKQWRSMLKPSGILGVMTGMRPPAADFPDWWYKNDPTHVSLFSRVTMDYIAQRYSMNIIYAHRNVTLFQKTHRENF